MELQVRSVDFAGTPCSTRIPFRFGIVTLTEAPLLTARVGIVLDGTDQIGFSADLAVPKWFAKDPGRTAAEDIGDLIASASRARLAFDGLEGTPFEVWHRGYCRCVEGDLATGNPLLDGFGVALVERAMLDATCRASGSSLRGALEKDLLGFDPGVLIPETAGLRSPDVVAAALEGSVQVRHTVGGLDPLRSADVPADLRGHDGHPVALEEDIRAFGLGAFKLKAGGDPRKDLARLCEIARVVAECETPDPLFTLDANEQYPELGSLGTLLEQLERDPDGRSILEGLAYIEQPLPRALTFDPATADDVRAISQTVPLLIDEADQTVDAFARAFGLGYRGVSVKNCKGVFRALANRALCIRRGEGAFQTSEDLTNLPVLALQQDLATLAALGLRHTERNGHHFFPGLDVVPRTEAEAALAAHPDLYERRGDRIVLMIRDGRISLACQHGPGYGYSSAIDWEARRPIDSLAAEIAE